MFDVKDDAKGGFRRVEILTGPARRRRWSVDQKARICETACKSFQIPGVNSVQ